MAIIAGKFSYKHIEKISNTQYLIFTPLEVITHGAVLLENKCYVSPKEIDFDLQMDEQIFLLGELILARDFNDKERPIITEIDWRPIR